MQPDQGWGIGEPVQYSQTLTLNFPSKIFQTPTLDLKFYRLPILTYADFSLLLVTKLH